MYLYEIIMLHEYKVSYFIENDMLNNFNARRPSSVLSGILYQMKFSIHQILTFLNQN